uniref:Uncharacterized protein n=1 Tax=Romanomermis culicivorax TaxID=13658 RepID=A0A915KG04_ROMCU
SLIWDLPLIHVDETFGIDKRHNQYLFELLHSFGNVFYEDFHSYNNERFEYVELYKNYTGDYGYLK